MNNKPAFFSAVNNHWTLLLDRDGVINHEKSGDYIHTWEEFMFYDQVPESISKLSTLFKHIIVITNQRGVGKGLTKLEDLHTIHANMKAAIETAGGKIDAVYYCSELDNDNYYRKPNPGMGKQACQDFPDIDISRTIMVGNNISDMEFGRNLGCHTIFLKTTRPDQPLPDSRIDGAFESLPDFVQNLIPA
jgi:histidinol-phosphate phosphatase family protein